MKENLGAHIAALRKAKGMTQEQLASALGISAPAVSKWETESSCPDITLLCPLARALGTNLDTLLQFEESLPDEQVAEHMNKIIETGREQGQEAAEEMLQKLLHQYPASVPLKYNASAVLTIFEMMFPSASEEMKMQWKQQRKELMEYIRVNGNPAYRGQAVLQLASMALADEELETGERLLKELPEYTADTTMLWAQLYLKRDEKDKALEVIQKRLFTLVGQMQNCLLLLADEKVQPDAEKGLEICEVYRKMEEIFGCTGGMSDGIFAEVFLRAGEKEPALDSIVRFVDAVTGQAMLPNPLLFSAAVKVKEGREAASKEMRQMILEGLLTDEAVAEIREDERFQEAVNVLRDGLRRGAP